MLNPRLQNKATINGRLGSFWTDNLTDNSRNLVRALTRVSQLSDTADQLAITRQQWAMRPSALTTGPSWKFNAGDIAVLGPDLQRRIVETYGDSTGMTFIISRRPDNYDIQGQAPLITTTSGWSSIMLTTENCEFILFPVASTAHISLRDPQSRPLYAVPSPDGVLPLSIAACGRLLLLGIDYYAGAGVVIFKEQPITLFPEGIITAQSSRVATTNQLNFTYGVDSFSGRGDHIAAYMRIGANAVRLQRALAQVSGLTLVPCDTVIEAVHTRSLGARYITGAGVLAALYNHTVLPEGTTLRKDTVIGGGFRVLCGNQYRDTQWGNGLNAGHFVPISGINIPDRPCRAVNTSGHVRFYMGNDPTAEAAYWSFVSASETATGHYINDVLSLANNATAFINPLDFYFQNMLSDRSLVIELNLGNVGEIYRQRITRFIKENPPFEVNLLINQIS